MPRRIFLVAQLTWQLPWQLFADNNCLDNCLEEIFWSHNWLDNCLEENFWPHNWLDNCLDIFFRQIIDLSIALKKIYLPRPCLAQTDRQTDRRTWWLYDQLGPVGPSWWKFGSRRWRVYGLLYLGSTDYPTFFLQGGQF